jgi:hypothetical protein
MSATEDRVAQAVREIFEFGTAQPAQFSLADIRRRQPRRWTHRAVVVAVAAACCRRDCLTTPWPHWVRTVRQL